MGSLQHPTIAIMTILTLDTLATHFLDLPMILLSPEANENCFLLHTMTDPESRYRYCCRCLQPPGLRLTGPIFRLSSRNKTYPRSLAIYYGLITVNTWLLPNTKNETKKRNRILETHGKDRNTPRQRRPKHDMCSTPTPRPLLQ